MAIRSPQVRALVVRALVAAAIVAVGAAAFVLLRRGPEAASAPAAAQDAQNGATDRARSSVKAPTIEVPAGRPPTSADRAPSAPARAGQASLPRPPDRSSGEDGSTCDDGNVCTQDDQFVAGVCTGRPRNCDDGNPLTDDECTVEGCLHAFVDGAFGPIGTSDALPRAPGEGQP